jgi:hypothetical protein
MPMTSEWVILMLFAFGGGISVNFLRLFEIKALPDGEKPRLDIIYWLQFLVLPLIGSFLALVYLWDKTPLTALLALQIGASAPLIVKQFAAAVPGIVGGT